MRTIEIVVSPSGETRVDTQGFAGAECRQASEFVERALGARMGEELTAEFHQVATQQQMNHQGN